ncbi:hypothetical protein [Pseudofrankia sp. BMG5.36]|uniref:hypothetical protein n=1 Tax=Pseudofrankia sp. BMG5.36 TaxID=1834512 RepID=UPI0010421583|nr:hypothetical protein [Pseudofrankia sp. BMG5.36]
MKYSWCRNLKAAGIVLAVIAAGFIGASFGSDDGTTRYTGVKSEAARRAIQMMHGDDIYAYHGRWEFDPFYIKDVRPASASEQACGAPFKYSEDPNEIEHYTVVVERSLAMGLWKWKKNWSLKGCYLDP